MPSSGARSGTRPSRTDRGAGDGQISLGVVLECGHATLSTPVTNDASGRGRLYRCNECGCLQHPATRTGRSLPASQPKRAA